MEVPMGVDEPLTVMTARVDTADERKVKAMAKQLGLRSVSAVIRNCIRNEYQRLAEGVSASPPASDRLRAIAAEVAQLEQERAVIGSSSGAGLLLAPSAELIAQVRKELCPGVIATPTGFLAYGQDPVGNESVLTVDLKVGEIAMANADGEEVKQPLDLPMTAALAGMVSLAVSAAQELGAQGRSPRKADPVTHRGLGLTVWAAHPDDGHARIQLGGLEQRMHGLVLLQLVAELHSLVARATAEQLEIRQGLEKLMATPDTKAPALSWSRSHGEG